MFYSFHYLQRLNRSCNLLFTVFQYTLYLSFDVSCRNLEEVPDHLDVVFPLRLASLKLQVEAVLADCLLASLHHVVRLDVVKAVSLAFLYTLIDIVGGPHESEDCLPLHGSVVGPFRALVVEKDGVDYLDSEDGGEALKQRSLLLFQFVLYYFYLVLHLLLIE